MTVIDRDKDLILSLPQERDYNAYKNIEVGEDYEMAHTVWLHEVYPWTGDRREVALENGDKVTVLDVDELYDSEEGRRALVRRVPTDYDEEDADYVSLYWVSFEDIDEDINYDWVSEDDQIEWGDEMDYLTAVMQEKWGEGPYKVYVDGNDLDWMHSSGWKIGSVSTGQELIDFIRPNTNDFHLSAYHYDTEDERGKGFRFRISHHDVPMGAAYYVHLFTPPKEWMDGVAKHLKEKYNRSIDWILNNSGYEIDVYWENFKDPERAAYDMAYDCNIDDERRDPWNWDEPWVGAKWTTPIGITVHVIHYDTSRGKGWAVSNGKDVIYTGSFLRQAYDQFRKVDYK